MKIGQNTFVSVSYNLSSGGAHVESTQPGQPLEFIYGAGMMIPQFEANLLGFSQGDKFKFSIEAKDAYGEYRAEDVVELPREIFTIDGVERTDMLVPGNKITMNDGQGNLMMGTVKEVGEKSVTMDFNHPMAGKGLDFDGEVLGVREVTEQDIQKLNAMMGGSGCGCGCGEEECGDCDCDQEKGCGCGECN